MRRIFQRIDARINGLMMRLDRIALVLFLPTIGLLYWFEWSAWAVIMALLGGLRVGALVGERSARETNKQ